MIIYLGTDHAGFELKEFLKESLVQRGFNVDDQGAYQYDAKDDYPDFIIPVACKVSSDVGSRGIILGGSGQGEAIVANKIKGVRAAVYYGGPTEIVKLSRLHNDANILSLGARFLDNNKAFEVVIDWLSIDFEEGRHIRRLKKIDGAN